MKARASRNLIEVLYDDGDYIAFNKPPGLLVIPSPVKQARTLVDIVNRQCKNADDPRKLHPCHRIDRDTSGVILFARGKQNQKMMMGLFHAHEVSKKYIALVHETLPAAKGEFKKAVKDVHQRKFRKGARAESALTIFKVIKEKKDFSIVEVMPLTGRTNQIRIHFAQAKHPLVGDRKYAFARDYPLKFRRTALHAASLQWLHPVTRKKIFVESQLPKDMETFLTSN